MSRIKSFINWRSPKTNESRASQNLSLSRTQSQASINSVSLNENNPGSKMIFLEKITTEHFLIGN